VLWFGGSSNCHLVCNDRLVGRSQWNDTQAQALSLVHYAQDELLPNLLSAELPGTDREPRVEYTLQLEAGLDADDVAFDVPLLVDPAASYDVALGERHEPPDVGHWAAGFHVEVEDRGLLGASGPVVDGHLRESLVGQPRLLAVESAYNDVGPGDGLDEADGALAEPGWPTAWLAGYDIAWLAICM